MKRYNVSINFNSIILTHFSINSSFVFAATILTPCDKLYNIVPRLLHLSNVEETIFSSRRNQGYVVVAYEDTMVYMYIRRVGPLLVVKTGRGICTRYEASMHPKNPLLSPIDDCNKSHWLPRSYIPAAEIQLSTEGSEMWIFVLCVLFRFIHRGTQLFQSFAFFFFLFLENLNNLLRRKVFLNVWKQFL